MVPGIRRTDDFKSSNRSRNTSSAIPPSDIDFTDYTSYGYFGSYLHLKTRRGNINLTANETLSEPLIIGPTRRHGICQVSLSYMTTFIIK